MTNTLEVKPALGSAIRAISGKWGWFVALGVGDLILGGIASTNLMLANLASVLFIGAAVLVSGLFQIVHAFSARGLRSFLFWLLSGLVYAAAGAIIFYDPVLASVELSLLAGVFMVVAGVMRAWAGFHSRPAAGWRWIVAAGVLTLCVGVILIAAWPSVGLWLLGAMLVVDLIFQGWGFLAFGIALKVRASRHSSEYAHT
ncbi:HdeD family acid-resistance protein [Bradyrhizobium sp. ARR65]|uniref:HdeD family acid-resistance protein n=1 Tax=Bradyrhizobium sp. ARR65 TaxID=1040989 RepID=UPI0004665EA9|nr:HdeD family acid-resistance protein [Bradyrhizobium sp. ARR65]